MISPKSCALLGAINEQLYPVTFVFRAAGPADHISRIDGIDHWFRIYFRTSSSSFLDNLDPRFSFMKERYRSTVSTQVSRRPSDSIHFEYER